MDWTGLQSTTKTAPLAEATQDMACARSRA